MSLLEICRQLEITPTYWYKLEKGETSTISYDLLLKIEKLLSLNLGIEFSNTSDIDSSNIDSSKVKRMDLSRLNWIKVVTPAKDWPHHWALSPAEIAESKEPTIQQNGLTIIPLGFKQEGAEKLQSGDLVVLTQHAKVTHVVEVMDDQPYQKGEWFHRYIKIVWWNPEMDWNELPHREDVLGFDPKPQGGNPLRLDAFKAFHERWDNQGGLDAFRQYLARQLTLISELSQV